MSHRLAKRVILCGVLIAFGAGAFYIIRFLVVAWMWSSILYGRDLMDASATNARGDMATAETNFFGAPEHQSKTVVSLKRAGHWFSTTLIELRSWEVLAGLRWQDDDTLDLQLEFGCEAHTSRPVTAVGPINIVYHRGDRGHTPKVGYESFRRRDLPPGPCK